MSRRRRNAPKDVGKAIQQGYMPMFMTGQEIQHTSRPLEGDKLISEKTGDYETDKELWNRKLKESKTKFGKLGYTPLQGNAARERMHLSKSLKDVAKEKGGPGNIGLLHLVTPYRPGAQATVAGGHHRVALSAAEFKDHMLPIMWHDNPYDALNHPDYR